MSTIKWMGSPPQRKGACGGPAWIAHTRPDGEREVLFAILDSYFAEATMLSRCAELEVLPFAAIDDWVPAETFWPEPPAAPAEPTEERP